MGRVIYFTGGARSGKSSYAEEYIKEKDYKKKIYVATAIPFDEEMKLRVRKHREQRGDSWITIEGYKNLIERLKSEITEDSVILLDCLTNMVSNLMIMDRNCDWDSITSDEILKVESEIKEEVENLLQYIKVSKSDLVIVSNELGMGIVPAYPLGRHFRDICGRMNQFSAKISDEAYFIVSGIKMKLK